MALFEMVLPKLVKLSSSGHLCVQFMASFEHIHGILKDHAVLLLLEAEMTQRSLIITADDFGYAPERDAGIVRP